MRTFYIAFIFICFSACKMYAQHDHHHERNEIGISPGLLYGIDDKLWGEGVHLHYFRTLGNHSKWAVGGFIEHAWLKGNHFSVGAGVKYEVIERLHLGVLPGIIFAKHQYNHNEHEFDDGKTEVNFSMHGELVYDIFFWKNFHIGPAVDYSWSKDDSHIMLGVHAAFCF